MVEGGEGEEDFRLHHLKFLHKENKMTGGGIRRQSKWALILGKAGNNTPKITERLHNISLPHMWQGGHGYQLYFFWKLRQENVPYSDG